MSSVSFAQNIRGSATGPTAAPGYDHPGHCGQYVSCCSTLGAGQEREDKLAALAAKTGKKPNILVFLVDDVGWMDPGFNSGGVAAGNATPNMDKLA